MPIETIAICCSASFFRQAVEASNNLREMGFRVLLPKGATQMQKNKNFRVSDYKTWHKNPKDYKKKLALIKAHFPKIVRADAVLVLNYKKRGVAGYVGGNTLMEMAIALYFNKPIYLMHKIDEALAANKEEVLGCLPVFLDGKLTGLK